MASSPSGFEQMIAKFSSMIKDMAKSERKLTTFEYKGRTFLAANRDCLEHLENWVMPENSVVISSFPKTGSTWTLEVVRHILFGKDQATLERSKKIPMPMLLLEMGPPMKFNFFPQLPVTPKFFFTHLTEEVFNHDNFKKSKSKMIYIYRNPKDQLVSWLHFTNKIPVADEVKKEMGEEWDNFFTNHINGRHSHGLRDGQWYPDHVLGWLKHKDEEDFLLLEYEAMKKDFPKEIRRIAKFLGVDLTDDDVDRVVKNCSIGTMQKFAESDATGFYKLNVRKGEVGGWKDVFTTAQSELMDKLIEEKMAGSGINFTYAL